MSDDFDLSDEESLGTVLVEHCTQVEGALRNEGAEHETQPYRLDFSQHKGKTLDEVPEFVDWLVKKGLHLKRTGLKIAIDEYRNAQKPKASAGSQTNSGAVSQADSQAESQGDLRVESQAESRAGSQADLTVKSQAEPQAAPQIGRKRRLSQNELQASPIAEKKQRSPLQTITFASCCQPSQDAVSKAEKVSPSIYLLKFGKYNGKALDEVPPSYVEYLVENRVSDIYPDLSLALRARGSLPSVPAKRLADEQRLAKWEKPSGYVDRRSRFFDRTANKALWISASDAFEYFEVDRQLLLSAMILPISGLPGRYYLNQVYACAQHFRTVTNGRTAQALSAFLEKNARKERARTAGVGALGSWFCHCEYC